MRTVISANAYRASEAMTAVRTELRKRGQRGAVGTATLSANQRDDDHVAIIVTRDSNGDTVPARLRRTYDVPVTF